MRDCRTAPRPFSKLRKRRENSCGVICARGMQFFSKVHEACRWRKRLTALSRRPRRRTEIRAHMLYWLLYEQLYPAVTPFRVFRYVTSRAMFASLTSLFLCVALGPWLIRKLREFQIGQHIREDGPKSHAKKAGTPTMGGVLIVISIVVPTLLWADLRHPYVWIALFALISFAAIGFIDDYAKVRNKRNLGLTARQKFGLQMLVAAIICTVLAGMQYYSAYTTTLNVPFFK